MVSYYLTTGLLSWGYVRVQELRALSQEGVLHILKMVPAKQNPIKNPGRLFFYGVRITGPAPGIKCHGFI
jgi:hypothetical protein